jgi:hypothetical protein
MRRLVAGLGVIVIAVALPAVSSAAVIVGSPLSDGFEGSIGRGAPTVFVQTSLPVSGAQLTSPVNGTVVHWSLRGTSTNSSANTFRLRVLRPAGAGTFTGAGTSSAQTTPKAFNDDVVRTFDTSLAIRAGDQVGLDADTGADVPKATVSGAGNEFFDGFADGSPSGNPTVEPIFQETEMLFNAEVVAAPTTSATVPACSQTGAITISISTDPASAPKAVHFRVDGGAEQMSAAPSGTITITVPVGRHTLEYWGEDQVPQPEVQHHTAAVAVGACSPPSNAFKIGKPRLDKRHGTAQLPVTVPGAGTLALTGPGVVEQPRPAAQPGSNAAATTVGGAGTVRLLVKAKGKAKRKLARTGKAKVKVTVTFTPSGGLAAVQGRSVRLVKTK